MLAASSTSSACSKCAIVLAFGKIMFNLERRLNKTEDNLFRRLIQIEFSRDLIYARKLSAIPCFERTPNQNFLKDFLREKYPVSGKCPSELYFKVSKPLRREYNVVHRRIMEILHQTI